MKDLGLPDGSLVISILRDGGGFVPLADSVIQAGDEVLLVLDIGLEDERDRALQRPLAARRLAPSVAERSVDHLLIGGGLAAANCARWLREEGADGSVLLVGREPDPPYNRPPLSKGYLGGQGVARGRRCSARTSGGTSRTIELLTRTSVMKLDPDERVAHAVEQGRGRVRQGAARHGRERAPAARGAAATWTASTTCARSRNSDAIRADAGRAERVGADRRQLHRLRGGGVADAAHGEQCSIVMQEEVTLERSLGPEVGRFFQRVLEEHGVEIHGGDALERFEGSDGRVRKVVTESGPRARVRLRRDRRRGASRT